MRDRNKVHRSAAHQTSFRSVSAERASPTANLIQRKCACGSPANLTGECVGCSKEKLLGDTGIGIQTKLTVGSADDKYEQEADRIAEQVVNGAGVEQQVHPASLSMGALPVSHAIAGERKTGQSIGGQITPLSNTATLIQKQEPPPKPKSTEEKVKEAAKKTGEAFLETKPGKKIKETATDAATTLPGILITGPAAIAVVTYLAIKNKELPIQAPAIPLDKVHPGLSMKITVEGPLQSPTKATIGFSGKFGVPKKTGREKPKKTRAEKQREANAKKRKELFEFRESLKTPQEKARDQEMLNAWVLHGMNDPTSLSYIPGAKPIENTIGPVQKPSKKKEEGTVQRKKSNTNRIAPAWDHENIQKATQTGGQMLDPQTRSFMESRFGRDFSAVKIHSSGQAASSAESLNARAFTLGSHIVFGSGQYQPQSESGRKLLAHELTHVVQQTSPLPTQDSLEKKV